MSDMSVNEVIGGLQQSWSFSDPISHRSRSARETWSWLAGDSTPDTNWL